MMKKLLVSLVAVVLMLGVAGVANALRFTDTTWFNADGTSPAEDYDDHGWGMVKKLDGCNDFVKWTHHFDFNPPADEIIAATLKLLLCDDSNQDGAEYAFVRTVDGRWNLGEIDTGRYTCQVTNLSSLEDGDFRVMLKSTHGDFYIRNSTLTVCYEPVPEPTTLLLLGTGLIGFIGFGRKKLLKR